jgi:hypothetical protein
VLEELYVGLQCCDAAGSVRRTVHTLSGDVDQPVPSFWDRQIVKLITYSRRCLKFLGRAFVDISPHVSARLLLTHLYCCSAGLAPIVCSPHPHFVLVLFSPFLRQYDCCHQASAPSFQRFSCDCQHIVIRHDLGLITQRLLAKSRLEQYL